MFTYDIVSRPEGKLMALDLTATRVMEMIDSHGNYFRDHEVKVYSGDMLSRTIDTRPRWMLHLDKLADVGGTTEAPKAEAPKADAINPTHYQAFCKEMQWLETMQWLPKFRNPDHFEAAVELQVRKYIDRLGQKDARVRELDKSMWYLKVLRDYIENGGPLSREYFAALIQK
jgi:hypothetical protein